MSSFGEQSKFAGDYENEINGKETFMTNTNNFLWHEGV